MKKWIGMAAGMAAVMTVLVAMCVATKKDARPTREPDRLAIVLVFHATGAPVTMEIQNRGGWEVTPVDAEPMYLDLYTSDTGQKLTGSIHLSSGAESPAVVIMEIPAGVIEGAGVVVDQYTRAGESVL